MQTYLVGGAVRDAILGLPVVERDYVVVGADLNLLLSQGFKKINANFPVLRHPETGAEYAMARREYKIGQGYKGFAFEIGTDVTLTEDLARRDLTINAMAQDTDGNIIDPYNGMADIQAKKLRHVTMAFQEDPVRLLRIARFAARLEPLGFKISHETWRLLVVMAQQDELTSLIPHRLREELLKALATPAPWRFFMTLQHCGALPRLLPEIAAAIGDIPVHDTAELPLPMMALRRATAAQANSAERMAAMMVTIATDEAVRAKLGDVGVATIDTICKSLHLERYWLDLCTLAQSWSATRFMAANAEEILKFLTANRLLNRPNLLKSLSQVWQITGYATGVSAATKLQVVLQAIATTTAVVNTNLQGRELGQALWQQRLQAIHQQLEQGHQ